MIKIILALSILGSAFIAAGAEVSNSNRLEHAREVLREAKDNRAQGLEQQLKKAGEQLDALAKWFDQAVHTTADTASARARTIEQDLNRRVRRTEARALLLLAKSEISLAVSAAKKEDFSRAEQNLKKAADHLRSAGDTLGTDDTYNDQLDTLKENLRQAAAAIQARAADATRKAAETIASTDRLVSQMEADEQESAVIRAP